MAVNQLCIDLCQIAGMTPRSRRGQINFHKGLLAEDQVADAYRRSGFDIVERRWKSPEGELDLVAEHAGKIYFVEVKASRTHDRAAEHITPRQQRRIQRAAMCYLAQRANTVDVDCRFDAALVDGQGRLKVLPNAFLFD